MALIFLCSGKSLEPALDVVRSVVWCPAESPFDHLCSVRRPTILGFLVVLAKIRAGVHRFGALIIHQLLNLADVHSRSNSLRGTKLPVSGLSIVSSTTMETLALGGHDWDAECLIQLSIVKAKLQQPLHEALGALVFLSAVIRDFHDHQTQTL